MRRAICPSDGASCNARLRFFPVGNREGLRVGINCVNFFSRCLTGMFSAGSVNFVKFIAISEKCWIFKPFSATVRHFQDLETEIWGSFRAGPTLENRLARMLRLAASAMYDSCCLAGSMNPMILAWPDQLAETPRGAYCTRGFLLFDFLREIFHRRVCTPSRPLRGGKEGSACRAM